MIKTAFKNYFQYFKYFFLALAIIYSAILISGLIFYFGVLYSAKEASLSVYQNIINYFSSLATKNFFEILSADFLKVILNELNAELAGLTDFSARTAIFWTALAALILICSFKLAGILCKGKIRKNIATKNSLRGFFVTILRFIIWALFYITYLIIAYYWFFAVFLLPFVSLIISNFENLFLTWLVHFRKRVKFREIFNFKSALRLTLANLLLQSANIALIVLIAFINVLAALLIAMPLLTYLFAVADITSSKYFLDKNNIKTKIRLINSKELWLF